MATVAAGRVGKRGTIVIPAKLRRQFHLKEGSYIIVEACEEGILIRPAALHPVEIYTPERKAQFLLMNAVDATDYNDAVTEVRNMGLDPDAIPHDKPPGV
jgi:AbrB family looped-hinge helix DNA binding protein